MHRVQVTEMLMENLTMAIETYLEASAVWIRITFENAYNDQLRNGLI
jgi:hypothetical protein